MRKIFAVSLVLLVLFASAACQAESATAISDSLSVILPEGIVQFTAEEAAKNEKLQPVLHAVSDGAETLYIGALTVNGALDAAYIFQRAREESASGIAAMGTYADTNEFAAGLREWYEANFHDSYVVDVLSGQGGAPVFIFHVESEDGMLLIAETYSTDYSDSIAACFFDANGDVSEPTQAQYDAFVAMLKTISVK